MCKEAMISEAAGAKEHPTVWTASVGKTAGSPQALGDLGPAHSPRPSQPRNSAEGFRRSILFMFGMVLTAAAALVGVMMRACGALPNLASFPSWLKATGLRQLRKSMGRKVRQPFSQRRRSGPQHPWGEDVTP